MIYYVEILLVNGHYEVENNELESKSWCQKMKVAYHIQPGQSFGELPSSKHKEYLDHKCYRFFCKPHPLAGKGVFPCEALTS
jgi:hypothetical protein